ncbi:MAG TPA: RHS repeat-associated core domain-containing protein [Tepidisphaeraceae bacterium]
MLPHSDSVPDAVASESRSQVWSLDALGNWNSLTNDGGTPEARTHNAQNQITGSDTYTYDNNGNLTGINPSAHPGGQSFTYDAWNRRISFVLNGSSGIRFKSWSNGYDALGRRIVEGDYDSDTLTTSDPQPSDLYFSKDWQVIEQRDSVPDGGETTPNSGGGDEGGGESMTSSVFGYTTKTTQYVWSLQYVNAMVLRDGDERIYVQHDANFNTTALVSPSGSVLQRFIYDPYGSVTVLDSSWASTSDGYEWLYLHQGGRLEVNSGLYNFRHRDYSPTLGRWVQQDYAEGYADGGNLYQYLHSGPTGYVDPEGSESSPTYATGYYANKGPGSGLATRPNGFVPGLGFPVVKGQGGALDYPVPPGWTVSCYPQGCFATPRGMGGGPGYLKTLTGKPVSPPKWEKPVVIGLWIVSAGCFAAAGGLLWMQARTAGTVSASQLSGPGMFPVEVEPPPRYTPPPMGGDMPPGTYPPTSPPGPPGPWTPSDPGPFNLN